MKEAIKGTLKMLCTAALLSYAIVVCYWLLYPYNVIDVYSITILNKDKRVEQGGILIYAIDYYKYFDIVGTISRKLVNDFTINYSDITALGVVGKRKVERIPLPVPDYASPGKYHLLWKDVHKVNPMRSVVETAESDEFEVIAKGTNFNVDASRMESFTEPVIKQKNKSIFEPPKQQNSYVGVPCPGG